MKIASVETIRLSIPFDDLRPVLGVAPAAWDTLDFVLVRIETDTGIVGWGEAFSYFCAGSVKAMLDETVLPMLIGQDAGDPAAISEMLQRNLVLFGRYGVTIFALSGIDIALWDIAGKAQGKSVSDLIGGAKRSKLAAYASLVRYGKGAAARHVTEMAQAEGYDFIKLHEISRDVIAACLPALGEARLMIDVNCEWDARKASEMAVWLAKKGVFWLEEPTFPPEDFAALSDLAKVSPIASGENLCTSWQFKNLIASGNVRYLQPSVTKVGGISEMLKIMGLAAGHDVSLMPHSPYFGPGYLASLHIGAVVPDVPVFEYLYVWPKAQLYDDLPVPQQGFVTVPTAPGLGMDPNPDVIRDYLIP